MTIISRFSLRRRKAFSKARNAFTLVELLVVIAIISLLAGMLLPALARAQSVAIGIDCTNRMKQAMLAMHMYENDFSSVIAANFEKIADHEPQYYVTSSSNNQASGIRLLYEHGHLDVADLVDWWTSEKLSAKQATSLLWCPGVKYENFNMPAGLSNDALKATVYQSDIYKWTNGNWSHVGPTQGRFLRSYALNGEAGSGDIGLDKYVGKTLNDGGGPVNAFVSRKTFKNPSRKVTFMEARQHSHARKITVDLSGDGWLADTYAGWILLPHSDTANYSCYDGHIETITKTTMIAYGMGDTDAFDVEW